MVGPPAVRPITTPGLPGSGSRDPVWTADSGITAERWMKGFHGAVQSAGLHRPGELSVRDMAMSRRSLGVQRMAILTELPKPIDRGVVPSSTSNAKHVGFNGHPGRSTTGTPSVAGQNAEDEAKPARASPASRRPSHHCWDGAEPLTEFIDRRLLDARILLLPNRSRTYAFVKRFVDIVGSLTLIVLAMPILVVLTILIRLDSPGPAIFRQTRVTAGGRTFRFYKFRTMWVDARRRFPELYDYDFADTEFDQSYYKLSDDPRNTSVGRWLRRTTLDELPNLFNVLKGDLSLVGPRPELPELVQYYRPEELVCFFTKAGLTGLAQVAGRSLLTVRQRLTLDMRYVSQQTFLLDQRILWRTAIVVLLRRGAF